MDLLDLKKREAAYRAASERAELKREERNAAVREALAAGFTHQQIADATGLTRGRINQLREDRRLLTGPIREGDQLIWEPDKPHAFTHVEVVELRDEGDGLWIKLAKPDGTGHWNEESRVREACVRR